MSKCNINEIFETRVELLGEIFSHCLANKILKILFSIWNAKNKSLHLRKYQNTI